MLNKEYIKKLLNEEINVELISITRTHFSLIMTEFYFFEIFIHVLKISGIDCEIHKQPGFIDDNLVRSCYIHFTDGEDKYITQYDSRKFERDLQKFNNSQVDMGMLESAQALINIFVSLLE